MKPHKHAELIKAWADGAEIEYKSRTTGEWEDSGHNCPRWHPDIEYRIKPEPKSDVVRFYFLDEENRLWASNHVVANLKIIRDGETGELKSAEVLK